MGTGGMKLGLALRHAPEYLERNLKMKNKCSSLMSYCSMFPHGYILIDAYSAC